MGVALLVGLDRWFGLGRWSLWLDEVYTLADARHGGGFANPVGYRLFGWFYDLLGGRPEELALRAPAALFGWLSIGAAYFALSGWVGKRGAAVAALVVALSPWHLYWSQNARFYTLASLLVLVSIGVLPGALAGRSGAVPRLVLGVVAAGLALLTHPSAAIALGPLYGLLGLACVLRREPFRATDAVARTRARRARRLLVVLVVLAAVVGLGWASTVWSTWAARKGEGNALHLVLSLGYLVTPGLGLLVLVALVRALRTGDARLRALCGYVGAGLAVALGAALLVRVSAQYVFVFLPLLAGVAASALGAPETDPSALRNRTLRLGLGLLALLPLAVESALVLSVRHGDRPRWRAAYRYVFDHGAPTDLVLGMEAPVAEYYLNPRSDDLRQLSRVVYLNEFHADVPRDWASYGRTMWLVVNREQFLDWPERARERIRSFLDGACTPVARFEVAWTPRDLTVEVFRYPAPAD